LKPIQILEGEHWWGGMVADGGLMPFCQPLGRNLALSHYGNQAAPLLLSSHGRYVWSELPFQYRFETETLEVEPQATMHPASGQGSLRSAYLAAAASHFPPSGTLPHPMLFTHPQ
jgi:alpha-glucosidase